MGAAVPCRFPGGRSDAASVRPSSPAASWSVLHLGQYSVRGEGKPAAFNPDRLSLAPAQIVYRNGLRQVSCTYRNHPLAARSPAAELSQVRSFQGEGPNHDPYAAQKTGLFELWNPERQTRKPVPDSALLDLLVYPDDTAAFAVGMGGESPVEIADTNKPWRVSPDPSGWSPPADAIVTTKPYLRTVPVGVVRVEGEKRRQPGEGISEMSGPAMPPGVFPMVRSLTKIEEQQDPVFLLCDTTKDGWVPGVVNSPHSLSGCPDPPSTFDSWPIAPAPPVPDRAALYSFLAQSTDTPNIQGPGSAAPDLTLDDPGVKGFAVTLSQIYPVNIPGTAQTFDVRRATPYPADKLKLLAPVPIALRPRGYRRGRCERTSSSVAGRSLCRNDHRSGRHGLSGRHHSSHRAELQPTRAQDKRCAANLLCRGCDSPERTRSQCSRGRSQQSPVDNSSIPAHRRTAG